VPPAFESVALSEMNALASPAAASEPAHSI
jgi:hypothetical protein